VLTQAIHVSIIAAWHDQCLPPAERLSMSIYPFFIPVVVQKLRALSGLLDKAAAHCEARNIDPSVMISMRLAPDMFPLTKQIQIATDMVKNGAARLSGIELPKFEDDETSISELQDRINQIADLLMALPESAFDGADSKAIHLTLPRGRELDFNGLDYLNKWILPNFYFHMATTYNLLRHNGVELGKSDFLA
jgi:hypothetical protein